MNVRKGWPCGSIEARRPAMRGGTSPFTVIAPDAQGFVDQQYIGGFAKTLLQQKRNQFACIILSLQPGVTRHALSYCFLKLGTQSRILS
jgi:hypothetical protein